MVMTSSRWPSLLCMAIVFLGWFGPLIGAVETSNIYKVLKNSDNMGGACDDKLTQVNNMAQEVQKLVGASIEAIDLILKNPSLAEQADTKGQGKKRERILLLARQLFGAKFTEKFSIRSPTQFLKLEAAGKATMTTVRGNFQEIKDYINSGGDSKWRFACGDSWVKNVKTLQTEYTPLQSGTPILEVDGLKSGIGNIMHFDYTWFDQGGPTMNPAPPKNPNESQKEQNARFEIQKTWYYPASKGWSKDGPCSGINFKNGGPDAETMDAKRIIYFCPRIWDKVARNVWKADLTQLTGNIPTDGTAHIDNYQSPGATLLHEMTHQLCSTNDDLGYDFANVQKGRAETAKAIENADSYNYFAAAAYLSEYEWHSGVARTLGTQETQIHTTSR